MPTSRLVPGRYPSPNTSAIADRIRERRGARGLTPLDGTLLHVPLVAEGWNSLLGAVRTKGKLSGDIRELMILRVAAINLAAFEWIHHEHVGRDAGLTTEQLYLIRDTTFIPSAGILSPLQSAALAFAHHSTTSVKVPPEAILALTDALRSTITSASNSPEDTESLTQDLLVESAAVIASYNMVSRFLVSLDVAAMSDSLPPWPATKSVFNIPLPVDPANGVFEDGHFLYAETYVTNPDAPWIVCANSLLTDTGMWEWALPNMLAPLPHGANEVETLGKEGVLPELFLGKYKTYNVLLHDQRGHGKSSFPTSSSSNGIKCTIPILASDIAFLMSTLILPSSSSVRSTTEATPKVHAVIGVSQGGAAVLAFASMYPTLAKAVVSCDTGPRTPEGNKVAWEERIKLARDNGSGEAGMGKLAHVTVPRWFPAPSRCSTDMYLAGQISLLSSGNPSIQGRRPRSEVLISQITSTPLEGFALGASALQDYDLLAGTGMNRSLLDATETKVLLVAGSLDGGGKVAIGMKKLKDEWNAKRVPTGGEEIKLEVIDGAGHLPMVDETEKWWAVVGGWLAAI